MKKQLVVLAATPALFFAAGFGAGHFIGGSADSGAEAHSAAPAPAHAPGPAVEDSGHGTVHVSADTHATEGAQPGAEVQVVTLGRMMVPVYKSNSVSYVVADLGVAVSDPLRADEYMIEANLIQMRDAIYESLVGAASSPVLAGAAIDTDALSRRIMADIAPRFTDVTEVLFLSFYKQDVPLS